MKPLIVFQLPDGVDHEEHEQVMNAVKAQKFLVDNYDVIVISNCVVSVYPYGLSVFKMLALKLKSWLSTAKITKLK